MLEKILEVGTIFDWISPVLAGVQDLLNGPSHTFFVPEDCYWSGQEVANLLRNHGIKTWGHMTVNRMRMITVRQAQAPWAQYLLDREGIPIKYGAIDRRTARRYRSTPKDDHPEGLGLLDHCLDAVADLLGL